MLFSKTMLLLTYLSEKVLQISFPFRCSFIAVNLPGLITACYSSWHNDWSKTFLNHPFLLPTFTYFSFRSNSIKYCSSAQLSFIELCFSLRATCANILFPLLGVIICLFIRPSLSLFTSRSDHTFVQKASPSTFAVRSLRDTHGALTLASSAVRVPFSAMFLSATFSSQILHVADFALPLMTLRSTDLAFLAMNSSWCRSTHMQIGKS